MSAAHRDKETGSLHGHTWEVWASFPYCGQSAVVLQTGLAKFIEKHDHSELPIELAWAEDFAEYVGLSLGQCIAVDILRSGERLSAHWSV